MTRLPVVMVVLALAVVACARREVETKLGDSLALAARQRAHEVRLHVYADPDFRAQVQSWQSHFADVIQRINDGLGELPVRFTIEKMGPWDTTASAAELGPLLQELEQLDTGREADLVVGLVAPLPTRSTTLHELGLARSFGRHMVIRAVDNLDEHDQLMRELRLIPADTRPDRYRERHAHKESVIFLHTWAHTLGAPHTGFADGLMQEVYQPYAARFGSAVARVLGVGLRHHRVAVLGGAAEVAWRDELRALARAVPELAGEPLGEIPADEPPRGTRRAAEPMQGPLPNADERRVQEAITLLNGGNPAQAWTTVQAAVSRYPQHPRVLGIACQIWALGAAQSGVAQQYCERAVSLSEDDAGALLALGQVRLAQRRQGAAVVALDRARAVLEADAVARADAWRYLANLYQRASCIPQALDAIEHATRSDPSQEVQRWAERMRERAEQQAQVEGAATVCGTAQD